MYRLQWLGGNKGRITCLDCGKTWIVEDPTTFHEAFAPHRGRCAPDPKPVRCVTKGDV